MRFRIGNIRYVVSLLALSLAGCATSTLSREDAAHYADLNVEQFLVKRFVDDEKGVVSAVESGLSYVERFVAMGQSPARRAEIESRNAEREFDLRTTGLMPDGKSVVVKAHYSDMNVRQLLRPVVELTEFCEATNGVFGSLHREDENFVSAYFESPEEAFLDSMRRNYVGSVSYPIFGVVITQSLNDLKVLVSEIAAEQTSLRNQFLDRRGAEKGYMDAASAGAFGTFACVSKDEKLLWGASVLPFSYRPGSPTNQFVTHRLKIIVTPILPQEPSGG